MDPEKLMVVDDDEDNKNKSTTADEDNSKIATQQNIDDDIKSSPHLSVEDNSSNIQNLRAEITEIESEVESLMFSKQTAIRNELANLTFEELEGLKHRMGMKVYNEAMFGKQAKTPISKRKQMEIFKRENKNRPRELSSRVHVPKTREIVHVKKVATRDPRFHDRCGELNRDIWDKNYNFLHDIQKEEIKQLQKSVKKEQDDEKRTEIRKYIQTFKNKEKSKEMNKKEVEQRQKLKEDNIKRLAEGKNPFYMKKSTKKFLDLADKYEELKQSGKLDKYLKKKRKKNLVRDKKVVKMNSSQH